MATPVTPPKSKDFQFRRLQKPEEFRSVEEVHRAAGGLTEDAAVPTPVQRAVQDNGGIVIGAFVEIYLAGFALGFLGWDGEKLYHYAHVTAVRPEYQNHHLGFRLKTHQRDEVLKQGLDEVRSTFDPLQSRTAFLNVRRLGVVPDRYLLHYYGRLAAEPGESFESDRVHAVWKLNDPAVVARLEGKTPSRAEDEARFASSEPIVETEVDDQGLRVPTAVKEPAAPTAHLEVPFDLELIHQHAPGNLRKWRHATRDAFRAAFDTGYVVEDFAVVSPGHERRSVYFLRAKPPAAPA
ncbi:MAG: GNAT family N-acetyltransferase [Thermoplasmata archaeon]|nr:GNAT family N-acetyltransferase [Thermoplasmata archaeon]